MKFLTTSFLLSLLSLTAHADCKDQLPMDALAKGSKIQLQLNGYEVEEMKDQLERSENKISLKLQPHNVNGLSTRYIVNSKWIAENNAVAIGSLRCSLSLPITTAIEKSSAGDLRMTFVLDEDAYGSAGYGFGSWKFKDGGSLYCSGSEEIPTLSEIGRAVSFTGFFTEVKLKAIDKNRNELEKLKTTMTLDSLL